MVEKNIVYLTISAPDVPKDAIKIDLQPDSLTFSGHSETKKTTYHVKLDFYAPVDVEKSVTHHTARDVEFVLRKKDKQAEYWPHLTKEKKKLHFLKTNFDKWVDEDEQDGVADENPMAGMGGMEGMGGMGGMGGDGGLGGIGIVPGVRSLEVEPDADTVADFSKLGGAGGFPGAGGPGGLGGDDVRLSIDRGQSAERPSYERGN